MNLLLTNDDGYKAQGINVLAEYLAQKHNVFIIAPEENRSAVSHCISIHKNLSFKQAGKDIWTCSGFPADCVSAGVRSGLLPVIPDAVISGINKGANLGTDILYSGTCAAARQGVLYGIPSAAFSLSDFPEHSDKFQYFEVLAEFAVKNLEKIILLSKTVYPQCFVNINAASIPKYKGAMISDEVSVREYGDMLSLEKCSWGYESHFNGGMPESTSTNKNDYYACSEGYVSIACISAVPTPVKAEYADGKPADSNDFI